MTTVAWLGAGVVALFAAVLRTAAASLVMTPRADALRDAAEGRPGATRVARLLEEPERIVPSINIVHSLLLVLAAVPSTWVIARETEGTTTALLLLALVVGLSALGDLIPRMIGRARPRSIAYRFSRLLAGVVAVGSGVVEILSDDAGDEEAPEAAPDEGEIGLIESVLSFAETIVREVMVPRTDMVTIPLDADIEALFALIDEHGYSRIPVAGAGGVDDIVGVVIAKDLLPRLASGPRPTSVSEVMRPVEHIPETKRVPELLRDMQASKSHLAIVVDEFGGTAGLVTIEDLLEELVGEIVDEYDEDEFMFEELEDGAWKVDGRLSVHELSEMIDIQLPNDEWDTVAGLVLGLAGRVPRERESFETAGVSLTVRRVQGRRVHEVVVRRLVSSETAPGAR